MQNLQILAKISVLLHLLLALILLNLHNNSKFVTSLFYFLFLLVVQLMESGRFELPQTWSSVKRTPRLSYDSFDCGVSWIFKNKVLSTFHFWTSNSGVYKIRTCVFGSGDHYTPVILTPHPLGLLFLPKM